MPKLYGVFLSLLLVLPLAACNGSGKDGADREEPMLDGDGGTDAADAADAADATDAADAADAADEDDGGVDAGDPGDFGEDGADGGGDDVEPCPPCQDISEIPPPRLQTLDVALDCPGKAPCGGSLDDTSWACLDVCLDQALLFAQVYGRCSAASLSTVRDKKIDGTLDFSGGSLTRKLSLSGTGVFSMPNACHGCRCTELGADLSAAGLSAYCHPTCTGGYCTCYVDFDVLVDETDTYTLSGNTITTGGGGTFDYCLDAGELDLVETSASPEMPGRAVLVAPADLITPEICDGLDNDKNGRVDDCPRDCPPPCNTDGVCGSGLVDVCMGARGWMCNYTSPHYEIEEVSCDMLDNDCDGRTDEDLLMEDCYEVCDGLDNDGDGQTDEELTDSPPACPTLFGECQSGVDPATCEGLSGWVCHYHSADYEIVEQSCDGKDNDCDGMTDEDCACLTGTGKIYILTGGSPRTIQRADLDGENLEVLIDSGLTSVYNIVVDPVAGKIYWYDFGPEEFWRADLDGGNPEVVKAGDDSVTQQWDVDPGLGHLYYECIGGICRIDVGDPATVDPILSGVSTSAVELDLFNRKLYWGDYSDTMDRKIRRATMEGSRIEDVLSTQTVSPDEVAADWVHKKIYYNWGGGIRQGGMDGTKNRLLLQGSHPVEGIALDLNAGKVYWAESQLVIEGPDPSWIRRANLSGSMIETILDDIQDVEDIDLYLCIP